MSDLSSIDLAALPFVAFTTPRLLPQCSGVYCCLAANNSVLYIGSSWNIRRRWYQQEKTPQLQSLGCVSIAWIACTLEEIPTCETALIACFSPVLNKQQEYQRVHRSPMIECACRVCGIIFFLPQAVLVGSHKGHYCSQHCYVLRGAQRFISAQCLYCGREFQAEKWHVARGYGKLCSLACSVQYTGVIWAARAYQRMLQRIRKCTHDTSCIYCCWTWTGAVDKDGYPKFRRSRLHRILWEEHNQRPIPQGSVIRHLCHNPTCVNMWHLAIGTHQQNSDDMKHVGHVIQGSRHYRSKFTDNDILLMRQMYKDGASIHKLALYFCCSISNTRHICKRYTWKHLP